MVQTLVELPRPIPGSTLEQLCHDVAKRLGYSTRSREHYALLEILPYPLKLYLGTIIQVRNHFPLWEMEICRNREEDKFYIRTGWRHGFASRKTVEGYIQELQSSVQEVRDT